MFTLTPNTRPSVVPGVVQLWLDSADAKLKLMDGDGLVVEVTGGVLPAVLSAAALPTADPEVVGQVWLDTGVLTVSAGPA
jgi:hypothetical protein